MAARLASGSPVALYWEVYGVAADTNAGATLDLTLTVRELGGGPVAARVVRGLGELTGLRQSQDNTVAWTVERRRVAPSLPLTITIQSPERRGVYRLAVSVSDRAGGRAASVERVFAVSR